MALASDQDYLQSTAPGSFLAALSGFFVLSRFSWPPAPRPRPSCDAARNGAPTRGRLGRGQVQCIAVCGGGAALAPANGQRHSAAPAARRAQRAPPPAVRLLAILGARGAALRLSAHPPPSPAPPRAPPRLRRASPRAKQRAPSAGLGLAGAARGAARVRRVRLVVRAPRERASTRANEPALARPRPCT